MASIRLVMSDSKTTLQGEEEEEEEEERVGGWGMITRMVKWNACLRSIGERMYGDLFG